MNRLVLLCVLLCCKANAFNENSLDFSDVSDTGYNHADIRSFNYYQPDLISESVLKSDQPLSGPVNNWSWGISQGWQDYMVLELATAGFSYWGATNPTGFGWFLLTVGVGSLSALPEGILGSASLFALSDYNFRMADQDDLEEEDIFLRNFLALNAFYLTIYATNAIFPAFDGDHDSNSNFLLFPDTKGNWYLNYRYSF